MKIKFLIFIIILIILQLLNLNKGFTQISIEPKLTDVILSDNPQAVDFKVKNLSNEDINISVESYPEKIFLSTWFYCPIKVFFLKPTQEQNIHCIIILLPH